ncbi:thioesterase-3 [Chitinivorax tropicus]|uniref:Thioesterase-3 n=1 Tax=Chitinivorax tropicus TaxID=714531 RepID=A0A840MPK4_9PROT|nr:thioesterase family protein [Chitinivorax tropicus]MBB5019385.1 thioesterase-3 [Chitinivorax tropicus]
MTTPHLTQIRVRGYHLDVYQHVNNARYLEFIEEARWAYFEENGVLTKCVAQGLSFIVANININYRRPALLNEALEIRTGIKALNRRSGVLSQVIYLQGTEKLIADAEVTFVLYDVKQEKAIPIDGELLESLTPYVLTA